MNFQEPYINNDRDFEILPNGDIKFEDKPAEQRAVGDSIIEQGSYLFDLARGIPWNSDIAPRGNSQYVYGLIESYLRDKYRIQDLFIKDIKIAKSDFDYNISLGYQTPNGTTTDTNLFV